MSEEMIYPKGIKPLTCKVREFGVENHKLTSLEEIKCRLLKIPSKDFWKPFSEKGPSTGLSAGSRVDWRIELSTDSQGIN